MNSNPRSHRSTHLAEAAHLTPERRELPLSPGLPVVTGRVGGHLKPITAKLHAAPAPCSLLAGVVKVQDTLSTFANTLPIDIGKQTRGRMGQWSVQIVRPERFEP